MIASLRGTVIELEGNLVHGVGYQVFCTQAAAATLEINTEIKIVTYTEVREDAIRIFGFESKLEKQTFLLLTLVKGIGPKSALDVLSRIDAKTLLKIIAGGDVSKLKAVKGIGQKTAERVVVDDEPPIVPVPARAAPELTFMLPVPLVAVREELLPTCKVPPLTVTSPE